MNRILILLFTTALLCPMSFASAQSELPKKESLISLDELLAIAEENSNNLHSLEARQMRINHEISGLKKNWMDHIFLSGNMNYGTGYVLDEINTSGIQGLNYTNRKNTFYNLGVNLYLPMSKVANRKYEVRAKEMQIQEIEYLKSDNVILLQKEVIRQYSSLLFHLDEMELLSKIMNTYQANMILVEKSFRNGNVSMEEYKGSVDTFYNSKLKFEKSKSQAFESIELLSALVGQSIFRS